MANYLVTGAAGFIGARVAEMLIEQGHTVTGVDNLNDAYDVRMKEYRLRKLAGIARIYLPQAGYFRQDQRLPCRICISRSTRSSTWPRGPGCAPVWKIPGFLWRRT